MFSKGKREKNEGGFMKDVLRLTFGNILFYQFWQMMVFTFTDKGEAHTLTQWVFTFWGVEVGLLMLKTLFELWREHRAAKKAEAVVLSEEVADEAAEECT